MYHNFVYILYNSESNSGGKKDQTKKRMNYWTSTGSRKSDLYLIIHFITKLARIATSNSSQFLVTKTED